MWNLGRSHRASGPRPARHAPRRRRRGAGAARRSPRVPGQLASERGGSGGSSPSWSRRPGRPPQRLLTGSCALGPGPRCLARTRLGPQSRPGGTCPGDPASTDGKAAAQPVRGRWRRKSTERLGASPRPGLAPHVPGGEGRAAGAPHRSGDGDGRATTDPAPRGEVGWCLDSDRAQERRGSPRGARAASLPALLPPALRPPPARAPEGPLLTRGLPSRPRSAPCPGPRGPF